MQRNLITLIKPEFNKYFKVLDLGCPNLLCHDCFLLEMELQCKAVTDPSLDCVESWRARSPSPTIVLAQHIRNRKMRQNNHYQQVDQPTVDL